MSLSARIGAGSEAAGALAQAASNIAAKTKPTRILSP
jgi:hypothetical protein